MRGTAAILVPFSLCREIYRSPQTSTGLLRSFWIWNRNEIFNKLRSCFPNPRNSQTVPLVKIRYHTHSNGACPTPLHNGSLLLPAGPIAFTKQDLRPDNFNARRTIGLVFACNENALF